MSSGGARRFPWGADADLKVDASRAAQALAERADVDAAFVFALEHREGDLATAALVGQLMLAIVSNTEGALVGRERLFDGVPVTDVARAHVDAVAALVYAAQGMAEATAACDRAADGCRHPGLELALSAVLLARAIVRANRGDSVGGLADARGALALRSQLGRDTARAHGVLGVVLHLAGDLPGALIELDHGVEQANERGDRTTSGTILISRAIVLRHLGRVDEALVAYDDAIESLTRHHQERLALLARMNRGVLLTIAGRSDEAIAELRDCRAQARRGYPMVAAAAAHNLAHALRDRQAWEEARRLHEEVLALSGVPSMRASAMVGLAEVALAEGRFGDAERHVEQVLVLVDVPERQRAFGHRTAARLAAAQHDVDGALRHLAILFPIAERLGEPAFLASILSERAVVTLERGDVEAAAADVARGESLIVDVNDVSAAFDVHLARLLVGLARGDEGTARESLDALTELGQGAARSALPGQRRQLAEARTRVGSVFQEKTGTPTV